MRFQQEVLQFFPASITAIYFGAEGYAIEAQCIWILSVSRTQLKFKRLKNWSRMIWIKWTAAGYWVQAKSCCNFLFWVLCFGGALDLGSEHVSSILKFTRQNWRVFADFIHEPSGVPCIFSTLFWYRSVGFLSYCKRRHSCITGSDVLDWKRSTVSNCWV